MMACSPTRLWSELLVDDGEVSEKESSHLAEPNTCLSQLLSVALDCMESNNLRCTVVVGDDLSNKASIRFEGVSIAPDMNLTGLLTFGDNDITLVCSLHLEAPEIISPNFIFTILEALRKRNHNRKIGALYYDPESNSIESVACHKYHQSNNGSTQGYIARLDLVALLTILFSSSYMLFQNNALLIEYLKKPAKIPRLTFTSESSFSTPNLSSVNSSESTVTTMMNSPIEDEHSMKIRRLKQVLTDHLKCEEATYENKIVEWIKIEESIGESKTIGHGGFNEVYCQQFKFQMKGKGRGKWESRNSRLVYSKPRVKKDKTTAENLELMNNDAIDDAKRVMEMEKATKKIKKKEEYIKKKRSHENTFIKNTLSKLHSRNIVKHFINKASNVEKFGEIFLERCPYSDLHSYRILTKTMTMTTKLLLAIGISEGVHTLHANNIIHKDLKPQNVFISHGLTPKIGDFGESWKKTSANNSFLPLGSTAYYDPPEIRENMDIAQKTLRKLFSPSVDVFAYGLILAELFFDVTPKSIEYFSKMPKVEQIAKVFGLIHEKMKGDSDFLHIFYVHIVDVISQCLQTDSTTRWSITVIEERLLHILAYYQAVLF